MAIVVNYGSFAVFSRRGCCTQGRRDAGLSAGRLEARRVFHAEVSHAKAQRRGYSAGRLETQRVLHAGVQRRSLSAGLLEARRC